MSKTMEVVLVLCGGIFGGLVSQLDTTRDSVTALAPWSSIIILLLVAALKGSLSAGFGVYLLTTADPTQIARTFFFAAACGLSFPVVLENTGEYTKRATARVADAAISKNTEDLEAAAKSIASASTPGLPSSAAAQLKTSALNIIEASQKAQPEASGAADVTVQRGITEITKPTAQPTPETVDLLREVGTAAAAQGLNRSRQTASQELKNIASMPQVAESVKERALSASRQIDSAPPVHR